MTRLFSRILGLSFSFVLISACGEARIDESALREAPADSELAIEARIGPITSVDLGEIDPALVTEGEKLFNLRCTACHQLENALVGPPLKDILGTRSPVYVLNMILNPTEMLEQHPDAIVLLDEFAVPMADLGISETEARAILEYLR